MKGRVMLGLIILLLSLNAVSASVISFTYNASTNDTQGNTGITYAGNVVFQITTLSDQLCRYGTDKSLHYTAMNSFDENLYTTHKKELVGLSNAVHTYFVKCRPIGQIDNESFGHNALEATFKISNPISAILSLQDDPLTAGTYEIDVVTSKVPASTPELSYSYDGVVYTPLVLQGSEKSWKAFLVIDDSPIEKVGSFKFQAVDLEGRSGEEISGDKIFIVDTKAPEQLFSFSAVGEFGGARLEWFLDEDEDDLEKINIYRSENPNVDLTDFHASVDGDKEEYTDTSVEDGTTYYYRVAAEDEAGNIGSLSRELRATTLLSQSSSSSSGLAPEFLGKVDALLTEITLLEDDIERSASSVGATVEDGDLKAIGVSDALTSSQNELVAMRKTVDNLKLQDLDEATLDTRIASQQVKLNVIRKRVPDTVSLVDSAQRDVDPSEEDYRIALLQLFPDADDSLIDKSVKESRNLAEDKGLSIRSELQVFDIVFLDGSKETVTLVEHFVDSTLESVQDGRLTLRLPASSLDVDALEMKNIDYSEEKEDFVSFDLGTKKVTYLVDRRLEASVLSAITLAPVVLVAESAPLTGYFSFASGSAGSIGVSLLIIVVVGLLFYLFYMKRTGVEDHIFEFLEKAKEVKRLRKQGKSEEAASLYAEVQMLYAGLSNEEKHKVFSKVKKLHEHKVNTPQGVKQQ